MQSVLIVGFGIMGRTAGALLKERGFAVQAYDPFPAGHAAAAALNIPMIEKLHSIVPDIDTILLFLPGPVQIEACMTESEGILAGTASRSASHPLIVVDMCTSDPACTEKMANLSAANAVGYLDAPVLGRPGSVGNWCLPVGGDAAALEVVRPVLEVLATNIRFMGASGNGHRVKLLNQMMFGAINAMTAEMMAVAEKVGVAPALLYDTITSSRAGTVSNLFVELGGRVRDEKYTDPTFSVDMLAKDVRLGLQMAQQHGATPLLGRVVDFMNESARGQGLGNQDTACMWRAVQHYWK